jgi:hypothetical protein
VLDDFYDQIPDDILECWATCIWAIQAILIATARHREYRPLSRPFEDLRNSIYRLVALRQEEMDDLRILRVLDALSTRFGSSMKLDREAIHAAHKQAVHTVLSIGGSGDP